MQLTDKQYAEFKALCEKEGIHYEIEAEYREAAYNLVELVRVTLDLTREHYMWEQRLKGEPKGFAIPSEGRGCSLCHTSVFGQVWFDKWGIKCMDCQAAIDKKIIPGYVFKDRDNNRHVTAAQLHWRYGLHPQTQKKLVRQGKLKPRSTPSGVMVFLRSENPDLPRLIQANAKTTK